MTENPASTISKTPAVNDVILRRRASPRMATSGIRKDGTIVTKCSVLEINSSVIIEPRVFNACAEHISKDLTCFNEFLLEQNETEDIFVADKPTWGYVVEELQEEFLSRNSKVFSEINSRTEACNQPRWKLYYIFLRSLKADTTISDQFPYVYRLIFSFKTGTLDDYSCSFISYLYLNHVNYALRNIPFLNCNSFKMYDGGSRLDDYISEKEENLQRNHSYYKGELKSYFEMLNQPCSNFNVRKKAFVPVDLPFITMRYFISEENTRILNNACVKNGVSLYSVIIVSVVNTLYRHALGNGFTGSFCARILNDVNARVMLDRVDKNSFHYIPKLGPYLIPTVHTVILNSVELSKIFEEARKLDTIPEYLDQEAFGKYEAIKKIFIKNTGCKYKSGKWTPDFFFRATELPNLDSRFSPEVPNNSVILTLYDRSSSPLECTYFDLVYYVFRKKIFVSFDFSREYFNDCEMTRIVYEFSRIVESLPHLVNSKIK